MEGDERPATVLRWELDTSVEQQAVRRPVPREPDQRILLLVAAARPGPIAAVLGRQDFPLELGIVVAIGPAEVAVLRPDREGHGIAHPCGEAHAVGLGLAGPRRVESPDARARRQIGTRILP